MDAGDASPPVALVLAGMEARDKTVEAKRRGPGLFSLTKRSASCHTPLLTSHGHRVLDSNPESARRPACLRPETPQLVGASGTPSSSGRARAPTSYGGDQR